MMYLRTLFIAATAFSLAACGEPAPRAVGEACERGDQCESDICDRDLCLGPCDLAGACPAGMACGVDPAGEPQCRHTCTTTSTVDGFGCEDGAEVACGFAQSVHCSDCGCEGGEFCSTRSASEGQCLPTLGMGAACTLDVECLSNECTGTDGTNGVCTGPCNVGGVCTGGLKCGVGADGQPQCRPGCTTTADTNGFACIGGEEVACGHAGGADVHCSDCGCSGGTFCSTLSDTAGECVAPRAVGAICKTHAECAGQNCSAADIENAEGDCQPARGEECTFDNCTSCDGEYYLGRYCAQSCTDDSDCRANEVCFGNGTTKQYWCRADCTDAYFCGLNYYCHYYNSTLSVCLP